MVTLLLTSSVYVSAPFVKLIDASERAKLTLDSVKHWLEISAELRVVICDGSGYDFSAECRQLFPDANIECLHFVNDTRSVEAYGKGYGEGEIIKHALAHSEYLAQAQYFVKCTSKLWVANFLEMLKHWKAPFQCEFAFDNAQSIRNVKSTHAETQFYIVSKDFYLKNLLEAYKDVRDFDRYYLEHCFRDAVLRRGLRVSSFMFPIPPQIKGWSGTFGRTYRSEPMTKKELLKRTVKRLVILKANEVLFKPAVPSHRN